jgi:hypothetical protein
MREESSRERTGEAILTAVLRLPTMLPAAAKNKARVRASGYEDREGIS